MSPDQVLEAFGEHWIRYTGNNGYGPLPSAMGTTLPQFLGDLDMMHSRIAMNMAALRPRRSPARIWRQDDCWCATGRIAPGSLPW